MLAIELGGENPPSGMHTMVSVTAKGRWRRGTYSDASVAALGMAPPRPMPARKRSTPQHVRSSSTNAMAIVRTAKVTTLPSSAVAAAEAVAEHAADQAANHHPERPGGERVAERRAVR